MSESNERKNLIENQNDNNKIRSFQVVLKSLRKSFGITQEELANELNISRSTIGMYESGSREPDYETLGLIADYFNVDTDYLLGRTNKITVLPNHYYFDEYTIEIANFLHKNPEYKVLFDASKKISKEDIDFVAKMLDKFRK